jgi:hypothetical protein
MKRHLKTVNLALGYAVLAAATVLAASAPGTAGKPKAVPLEPIKDVGQIAKGESIVHDFLIRNEGDAPLKIEEVRPACGCTVADFDKTIAPGATGKIHVAIDTASFSGPVAKGVSVFTNDVDNTKIELTVRATVEPFIQVKPGYARYITVQGEPKEGTIVQNLWTPDGSDFEITSIESPYPFLNVTYREATAEERRPEAKGKQWRVEMHLSNNAPVGALADYVKIHTNHPKQKLVQIAVSGFVRPVIAVTPPVADFGEVSLAEPLRKSFSIKNFATEQIRITSVQNDVKGVETQLEPLQEGREYQVRVTLKPELGKGPFSGKVTLLTDSPKMPKIEVLLKGTVI